MPIRVQTSHGIVEFADGTPEKEMAEALSTLDAPKDSDRMPPLHTFRDSGAATPEFWEGALEGANPANILTGVGKLAEKALTTIQDPVGAIRSIPEGFRNVVDAFFADPNRMVGRAAGSVALGEAIPLAAGPVLRAGNGAVGKIVDLAEQNPGATAAIGGTIGYAKGGPIGALEGALGGGVAGRILKNMERISSKEEVAAETGGLSAKEIATLKRQNYPPELIEKMDAAVRKQSGKGATRAVIGPSSPARPPAPVASPAPAVAPPPPPVQSPLTEQAVMLEELKKGVAPAEDTGPSLTRVTPQPTPGGLTLSEFEQVIQKRPDLLERAHLLKKGQTVEDLATELLRQQAPNAGKVRVTSVKQYPVVPGDVGPSRALRQRMNILSNLTPEQAHILKQGLQE